MNDQNLEELVNKVKGIVATGDKSRVPSSLRTELCKAAETCKSEDEIATEEPVFHITQVRERADEKHFDCSFCEEGIDNAQLGDLVVITNNGSSPVIRKYG